ncbi:MAG: pilus assembly protein TadG-related protein [Bryobacteraceae bacterium]
MALLLFSLTAPFLLIMLALVLDVGWSYYTNKRAQNAADAAAMAAVSQVLTQVGSGGTVNCGGTAVCQGAGSCPASGNLQTACQYAAANGFVDGGDSGRQSFTIAGNASQFAPSVPNVRVAYWAEAVAQQSVPQWFSGLLTSTPFRPVVRSTAALRMVDLKASLYLLNRASDCFASILNLGVVCGSDFIALGANTIRADGGIYMASSNAAGLGLPNIAAGTVAVGGVSVQAPFTYQMGNGGIQNLLAGTNWSPAPMNGFTDGTVFSDPMAGKGQPPAPVGLPDHPVPGGVIVGSLFGAPTVLAPGNYYSTLPILNTPTGLPVTITGNVIFSDGNANPCGGFCNYVFYGGVITGALSTVTFSPGRYVYAGAQPVSGAAAAGLTLGVNSVVQDLTAMGSGGITQNSDAGEIFVFTSKNYPGLVLPVPLRNSVFSFPQVQAGISAGLNPQVTLHGLNASNSRVPADLVPFAPVLIWQDQANTTLKYTSSGMLDLSCGGPCTNILSLPGSQNMVIQGSTNGARAGVNMYGTIYGPRGSRLTILGVLPGDAVAGKLQIITGALQMALNASLDVQMLPTPPAKLSASLIQ